MTDPATGYRRLGEDTSEPTDDASVAEREGAGGHDTSEAAGIPYVGSGGNPPGAITADPNADLPDPLGREDDERELERRTE